MPIPSQMSPHKGIPQNENTAELRDFNAVMAGALLTISIILFQSFFSQKPSTLDWYQPHSLVAFGIAIPGLAFWYLLAQTKETHTCQENIHFYIGTLVFA